MKTSLFHYDLPSELIVQHPLKTRDASRLLVLHRDSGIIEHSYVKDLSRHLDRGDLMVVNESKVLKARLMATKGEAGANLEVFLLKQTSKKGPVWETLICPGKRIKGNVVLHFKPEGIAEVVSDLGEGHFLVNFSSIKSFGRFLDKVGHVPLPPYIKRADGVDDARRYQTVYAKRIGSVAAPTAGLHFTPELLSKLKTAGIDRKAVTLHVGLGTFLQVSTDEIEDHKMHEEVFEVAESAVKAIQKTRKMGHRVVAIGTTSLRALESASRSGKVKTGAGTTDIFIRPGYEFKAVDALFTNFHQPGSTLLMLVSALAGMDLIQKAYREAIEKKYRFLSYGDAMLIL